MTKQKYIGIENELKSFEIQKENNQECEVGFNDDDFQGLRIEPFFSKSDTALRSNIGNGYYIDGEEIEIITPPIALNKGFASRLTDALILGRNHIISNTPHLIHTGYSMHWNLSYDTNRFNIKNNKSDVLNNLSIPFQLFGLTPTSCGFNIRSKYDERFEVMGDSLTNEDQIRATALLLGAYSVALENLKNTDDFYKDMFPIQIKRLEYEDYVKNTLKEGRYSLVEYCNEKNKVTQAQNILELFYEWLSPFVYKLGERDEINNLEAFITGKKKLEMDDIKYFTMLKQNGGMDNDMYMPLYINTPKGLRSPVLQIIRNGQIKVPIEGILLGKYTLNHTSEEITPGKYVPKNSPIDGGFRTVGMEWESITIEKVQLRKGLFGAYYKIDTTNINGVHEIYKFAEQYHNKKYHGSRNMKKVKPNDILDDKLQIKLEKRIKYDADKDMSAC